MAALMGWAHPPNDSPQHDLKLHAWQMQGSAGYFEPSSPEFSRQYNSAMHFLSNENRFTFSIGRKVNLFVSVLTVHLQTDCDVHGASDIHSSADIFPSILRDSFFKVQTAVTPQKDPSIGLNLVRKKNKHNLHDDIIITQEQEDHPCVGGLHWAGSCGHPYRSSISGPVSFWKWYPIQQHAGNAQGLADAGDDDRGASGQERRLCEEDLIKTQTLEKGREDVKQLVAWAIISQSKAYPGPWHWSWPLFGCFQICFWPRRCTSRHRRARPLWWNTQETSGEKNWCHHSQSRLSRQQ